MKNFKLLWFLIVSGIALTLSVQCSHGSGSAVIPDLADNKDNVAAIFSLGESVESDGEMIVPVNFSDANDLYAASLRVSFDPGGLEPIEVDWTGSLSENDSSFDLLDRDGFVPLAFARLKGIRGFDGSGTLCRLKFKILNRDRMKIRIIDDPQFLPGYNSLGSKMHLGLRGDAK
ncbi:MAG: cohesin domain-containing protein [bacterium]